LQAGENFNLILGGEFLRLSVIDKDVWWIRKPLMNNNFSFSLILFIFFFLSRIVN
jgi:hypothetical protein